MTTPEDKKRQAAMPLYLQISESLIREIAAGRLADGARLPPERALAQQFGTTVQTLRKALAELEKKALLERRHGSGNYVRSNENVRSIYSMFRLELPQGGGLPRAEILSVERVAKPVDLPRFGTADDGTRIRRLRTLDHITIAVEEIWLDGDAGKVEREQLDDSLYRYYRLKLGFWIVRAEDRVSLGPVPNWAPPGFGKPPGAVVGYIERQSWAQEAEAVEFSRTWFDPDKALYVQRLN